jgi:ABC-2 type transport system ATP-binding protein
MLVEACGLAAAYILPFQNPVEVLHDVSFEIAEGQVVGVLGRNGAGKTTLLRMILGLLHPRRGTLHVFGLDPVRQRASLVRRCGSMLDGQRVLPPRWTPNDVLAFHGTTFGLSNRTIFERSTKLLERFGLLEQRTQTIMGFSRGMKQKLALCIALLNDPTLLILDEPTIGLDVESTRELLAQIVSVVTEERRSVILTSHQLNLVERVADRVLVIHNGRDLFFGSPSDLIARVGRGSVKLGFAHITPAFALALPGTARVEASNIYCPADATTLSLVCGLAAQHNAELESIEQALDFENAFLALTGGQRDLSQNRSPNTPQPLT